MTDRRRIERGTAEKSVGQHTPEGAGEQAKEAMAGLKIRVAGKPVGPRKPGGTGADVRHGETEQRVGG